MKSGNLNFLEPSGPLQACNGTALPLPLYIYIYIFIFFLIVVFSDRMRTCGRLHLQKRRSSDSGRVTTNKRCNIKATNSSEFSCSCFSCSSLSWDKKKFGSHLSHIPNIKLQTECKVCTCYGLQRKGLLEKTFACSRIITIVSSLLPSNTFGFFDHSNETKHKPPETSFLNDQTDCVSSESRWWIGHVFLGLSQSSE